MSNLALRTQITHAIAAIAASQYGIVGYSQLANVGATRKSIRHRVDRGELVQVRRGVYALPGRIPTFESRVSEAIVTLREQSQTDVCVAATGFTALALYGLSAQRDTIELVENGTSYRNLDGCSVHREAGFDADLVSMVNGIPTAVASYAIASISGRLTPRALQGLVGEAIRVGVINLESLQGAVDRLGASCTRQRVVMRELIESRRRLAELERAESVLEERFVSILEDAGISGFELQYEVVTPNGVRRLDIAFPERKFAIEIDGYGTHGTSESFHDDRLRDLDLRLLEWDILRVASSTQRLPFLSAVYQALGQRWHGSGVPRIDVQAGHRPHGTAFREVWR